MTAGGAVGGGRTCAVSIDLDGIGCYYRIHGLGPPPAELAHVIHQRALPRAAALFASRGLRVTWFVVGRDADSDAVTGTGSAAGGSAAGGSAGGGSAAGGSSAGGSSAGGSSAGGSSAGGSSAGGSSAGGSSAGGPSVDDSAARIRRASAEYLRGLAERGDELGNHSYSHPYELARLPAATVAEEIDGCDRVLRAITGRPTRGFRAPGYDLSPAMLDHLAQRGYRYDSSLFPAPGYYAAKAAVMAALALARRPSGAVLTNPRALAAPAAPYRPAMTAPWRRGQAPLVELPVAVTPWLRLPAIGTSLLIAPAALRRRLVAAMAGRPFWNFELHGIDFADAELDGIPGDLVARQPDLRIPIATKLARLEQLLDDIAAGWRVVTLAEAAVEAQRTE